ncbi:MAG: GTP-binding protein [Synechococcaceae cyanobacterium SM2_3_1]|nr:GTP-binding protein [Synechococcaceae cyanobacterium SM2_3_1]
MSGPPGVGKTTWIRNYLQRHPDPVFYKVAGSDSLPIDAVHLSREFPQVTPILNEEELSQSSSSPLLVEVPWQVNPAALYPTLEHLDPTWIGIVPSAQADTEVYLWADELIEGRMVNETLPSPHLWQAGLTGQVLDPASLEAFWFELIRGAYGQIYRVKGIFEMPEGDAIYGEYTAGFQLTDLEDFDILRGSRHLDGRPNRFSGVEILGKDLETNILKDTLQDCCLSDQALWAYHQQVNVAVAKGVFAA